MTDKKKLIVLIISTFCLFVMAIIFIFSMSANSPAIREEYSNLQFSYTKQGKYVYDISFEVYNIEFRQKEYNSLQIELINLDNSNSQVVYIENFTLDLK